MQKQIILATLIAAMTLSQPAQAMGLDTVVDATGSVVKKAGSITYTITHKLLMFPVMFGVALTGVTALTVLSKIDSTAKKLLVPAEKPSTLEDSELIL